MTAREPGRRLFVSPRERRLWLWVAVALTAIYSTLGPAQVVAAALRERNLLRLTLLVALLLLVVPVAARWLARRPGRAEIGVALAVAFVYFMVWARVVTPEERTHLMEYAVVAVLVHRALEERLRGRRPPWAVAALAFVLTVALGWIDEAIQALLPSRRYDWIDVGFNTFAAGVATGGRWAIGWARGRGARKLRRASND